MYNAEMPGIAIIEDAACMAIGSPNIKGHAGIKKRFWPGFSWGTAKAMFIDIRGGLRG